MIKKSLKYAAFGVLAVGLFFGKYLGRWMMYKLDSPNMINEAAAFSKKYLSGCDTLHLFVKKQKDTSSFFEARSSFNANSDLSSKYIDKFETVFFDNYKMKYFKIIYFFPVNSWLSDMYGTFLYTVKDDKDSSEIIATVNRLELADPSYGTKKKPIPILYFDAPNVNTTFYSTISGQPADKDFFKGTEKEFRAYQLNFNVKYYLSYVKSKADFEKMFGKQPEKKKWWQF